MRRAALLLVTGGLLCACGGTPVMPGTDMGAHGMDGGGPPVDGSHPGTDMGTMVLPDGRVCTPTFEICGDHIDQNCDGRDEPCGDNDHDGINACCPMPGTMSCPYVAICDCDDTNPHVFPSTGPGVPGAPELCDGLDNNCNGQVDESAMCCAGCAGMGDRGDMCASDGSCTCSGNSGGAVCAVGQSCCASGCVDLQTSITNCGYCGAACTNQSDHCAAGHCACGAGMPCALDTMCTGAAC